jgi:hypothetical protein
MSEENVELIRRITEAIDRGDIDGAVAIANPPPEFEFDPSTGVPAPDVLDVQRGPEGLRRVLELIGDVRPESIAPTRASRSTLEGKMRNTTQAVSSALIGHGVSLR